MELNTDEFKRFAARTLTNLRAGRYEGSHQIDSANRLLIETSSHGLTFEEIGSTQDELEGFISVAQTRMNAELLVMMNFR